MAKAKVTGRKPMMHSTREFHKSYIHHSLLPHPTKNSQLPIHESAKDIAYCLQDEIDAFTLFGIGTEGHRMNFIKVYRLVDK